MVTIITSCHELQQPSKPLLDSCLSAVFLKKLGLYHILSYFLRKLKIVNLWISPNFIPQQKLCEMFLD